MHHQAKPSRWQHLWGAREPFEEELQRRLRVPVVLQVPTVDLAAVPIPGHQLRPRLQMRPISQACAFPLRILWHYTMEYQKL